MGGTISQRGLRRTLRPTSDISKLWRQQKAAEADKRIKRRERDNLVPVPEQQRSPSTSTTPGNETGYI
ncbi:hypothetical protein V496_04012 [Pseudogymnoascus sp. VKM F-4515 (FW-2607)]|nr:hypothetical protein V496_04012 [Pseudogymnoascus sp. VKM F-4515 (FW-2607)]